jgi:hypothetical protein
MHVTFPYFKEICWRGWRRNLCLKCRAAIAAVIFEWAAKTHSLLCFSCCLPSFLPSFHGTSSHTTRVLFKNIWSLYPCVESSVRIEDFMREAAISTLTYCQQVGWGWAGGVCFPKYLYRGFKCQQLLLTSVMLVTWLIF